MNAYDTRIRSPGFGLREVINKQITLCVVLLHSNIVDGRRWEGASGVAAGRQNARKK
jgi:hypothetical protein